MSAHAEDAAPAAQPSADPPSPLSSVVVEQPRPFGYLVGDVLVQKIRLSVDGRPVEIVDPPRKDKIGVWLSRRATSFETRADGTRWMLLDYQIINASKDVDVIHLPKLHLRTRSPKVFLDVPEWPITVGAITPSQVRNQGGLLALQPDEPAPRIDTAVIHHRLQLALLGLLFTVLVWLGWWRLREWQASRAMPFARARRELRSFSPTSPAAWRAVHRAFDATAGRVVQPVSLPRFFEQAPQYAPLKSEIEAFYADSAALFFGGAMPSAAMLSSLCAKLRAIEKRHEP